MIKENESLSFIYIVLKAVEFSRGVFLFFLHGFTFLTLIFSPICLGEGMEAT